MVRTKTLAAVTAVIICLKCHTLAFIGRGFFRFCLDLLVFVSDLDFRRVILDLYSVPYFCYYSL